MHVQARRRQGPVRQGRPGHQAQIALVIPKSLEKYMANTAGQPVATRFRLRVLATKLGKSFTAAKPSPVIGPEKPTVRDPDGAASRPRRTAIATATALKTASTPTTTTTCSPTRRSSRSSSTRAAATPTATASRTASSTSPRSTSTTTTTSTPNYVTPVPGQDAVPEPAVRGRRHRLRRRRPDAQRRVQALEVHLRGQPHRDAHAHAAVLLRRRAVLALAARRAATACASRR